MTDPLTDSILTEDRERSAPGMSHADTHTPLHGPTGGVPSVNQGALRHQHNSYLLHFVTQHTRACAAWGKDTRTLARCLFLLSHMAKKHSAQCTLTPGAGGKKAPPCAIPRWAS
eukprot:scaffold16587_cov141-Isochrysis_galbana.AAC.2